MKFHLKKDTPFYSPDPVLEDEPDEVRRDLLYGFMYDFMRNEALFLAALERAEAGTPELNWGDHFVWVGMYPDGRVVIEKAERLLEDEEQDNPPQIVITIAEARKLILDWIAARDQWYAEREAQESARTAGGK